MKLLCLVRLECAWHMHVHSRGWGVQRVAAPSPHGSPAVGPLSAHSHGVFHSFPPEVAQRPFDLSYTAACRLHPCPPLSGCACGVRGGQLAPSLWCGFGQVCVRAGVFALRVLRVL